MIYNVEESILILIKVALAINAIVKSDNRRRVYYIKLRTSQSNVYAINGADTGPMSRLCSHEKGMLTALFS